MKKNYNRPQTEIFAISSEEIMQSITVSTNSGGGGGVVHAPARPGDEIFL